MESEKFKTVTQCDWYNVFSKEELILILSKIPDYEGVAVSVLVDKINKADKDTKAALDKFNISPTPENWESRKKTFNKYCKLNNLLCRLILPKTEDLPLKM